MSAQSKDPMYQLTPQARDLIASVPDHLGTTRPFVEYVLQQAQNKRANAGYGGSHSDGGASDLERDVQAFVAGMTGTCPPAWKAMEAEFQRLSDPEYATYLRLRKQFEGR